MRELKVVILIVTGVVAIAACGSAAVNNSTVKNANTAASPASVPANTAKPEVAKDDGQQLYADNCMICHKEKGTGGPVTVQGKKLKPADLTTDRRKKQSDDDMAKDISQGVPDEGMPAFKDKLKPGEIKVIVTYIRSLQN